MKMLCAINIIPDASLLKIKISIFFYRTPCVAGEKERERELEGVGKRAMRAPFGRRSLLL